MNKALMMQFQLWLINNNNFLRHQVIWGFRMQAGQMMLVYPSIFHTVCEEMWHWKYNFRRYPLYLSQLYLATLAQCGMRIWFPVSYTGIIWARNLCRDTLLLISNGKYILEETMPPSLHFINKMIANLRNPHQQWSVDLYIESSGSSKRFTRLHIHIYTLAVETTI